MKEEDEEAGRGRREESTLREHVEERGWPRKKARGRKEDKRGGSRRKLRK